MEYVYQLVADGDVVSLHRSMEEATELAEALPREAGVLIAAVPAHAPGPAQHWHYDYASGQWKQK